MNPDIFLTYKRRYKTRTHWRSVVWISVDFLRKYLYNNCLRWIMEEGFGRNFGPYVVLVAGIIMCLMGAYLMITEEDSTGIVIGGGGILFIGVSAVLRKKNK